MDNLKLGGNIMVRKRIPRSRESRKLIDCRDSESWNGPSEITGLFPYILNSIRESSGNNGFADCIYRPRRNTNSIIHILNLPENQIPQLSNDETNPPSSIPSMNSSAIFGRKISSKSELLPSKKSVGNKRIHSSGSGANHPKQLTPISKMLREKSGLGPDVIDLEQALHGSRIREYGSSRFDQLRWSARNSVRELLVEVIDSYQAPRINSSTREPKIRRNHMANRRSNTNPPTKIKGILKQPTPRFYSDRMNDVLNVDNDSPLNQIGSWRPSDNQLSERRVKVGELIENITVNN